MFKKEPESTDALFPICVGKAQAQILGRSIMEDKWKMAIYSQAR